MKQSTVSQYFSHQRAPGFLLRFPRILFLYFWLNRLSVLRMKYARRALRDILRTNGAPRSVVDAGCGMGDFLFTIPEFRTAERLTGLDVSPSNIEVCGALAAALGKSNMKFICSDLSTAALPSDTDLILCIAVLMYIKDDRVVLEKFYRSLSPDGTLAIYAAVNYRRNLQLFKRLAKNSGFDYDEIIGRMQNYTDESLEQRLKECGFTIQEKRYSFGTAAATMFEISSIFEWYFKSLPLIATPALIPLYLLFYPFYLLSMSLDFHTTRTTGNGVMIIAKKLKDIQL